jgi:hypothetical protein
MSNSIQVGFALPKHRSVGESERSLDRDISPGELLNRQLATIRLDKRLSSKATATAVYTYQWPTGALVVEIQRVLAEDRGQLGAQVVLTDQTLQSVDEDVGSDEGWDGLYSLLSADLGHLPVPGPTDPYSASHGLTERSARSARGSAAPPLGTLPNDEPDAPG